MGITNRGVLLALTLVVVGPAVAQDPRPPHPAGNFVQESAPMPDPVTGYAGAGSQWEQNRYFADPPSMDAIGPCCDQCGGGSGCPPLWSLTEEIRMLGRTRSRDVPISLDTSSGGDPSVAMSGKALQFEMAPGYSSTLGRYLGRDAENRDWFLEGGFWGFNHWVTAAGTSPAGRTTEDTANGVAYHGTLSSAFANLFPGLDWADHHEARYNSEFETAEVDLVVRPRSRPDRLVLAPNGQWHRECQPGLYWSFLAGFRYFSVREQFHLHGSGLYGLDQDRNGTIDVTGVGSGDYFINTSNRMYGMQLGAELMKRDCRCEYGMRFHVTPMINVATAISRVEAVNSVLGDSGFAPIKDRDTGTAVDIGFGPVVSYKLLPRLAIRTSYDVAWLSGLALAPEQIGRPAEINTHGTVFYHGLTLGLDWTR